MAQKPRLQPDHVGMFAALAKVTNNLDNPRLRDRTGKELLENLAVYSRTPDLHVEISSEDLPVITTAAAITPRTSYVAHLMAAGMVHKTLKKENPANYIFVAQYSGRFYQSYNERADHANNIKNYRGERPLQYRLVAPETAERLDQDLQGTLFHDVMMIYSANHHLTHDGKIKAAEAVMNQYKKTNLPFIA